MTEELCKACCGTGEAYDGNSWLGGDCCLCNGYGSYYIVDQKHYVRYWTSGCAEGPVLRGPDGRFKACPKED